MTRNGRTRKATDEPADRPPTADTTDTAPMSRTDSPDTDAPLVPLIHPGTRTASPDLDRLRREIETIRSQLDRIESAISAPGDSR